MPAGINRITIKDSPRLLPPGSGIFTKSPHKNPVTASIIDTISAIVSSPSLFRRIVPVVPSRKFCRYNFLQIQFCFFVLSRFYASMLLCVKAFIVKEKAQCAFPYCNSYFLFGKDFSCLRIFIISLQDMYPFYFLTIFFQSLFHGMDICFLNILRPLNFYSSSQRKYPSKKHFTHSHIYMTDGIA